MKIGIVCPYDMAKGGGVQEVVNALYRHLGKRGYRVTILAARPAIPRPSDDTRTLLLGNSIDVKWPTGTVAPVTTVTKAEVEAALTNEQFDILHFHEPWVPMLSRQILRCSTSLNIATFHAKIPESAFGQTMARSVAPLMRPVLRHLHELTAVSAPAAEYVGTMTDRPITIIPNGIEAGTFRFAPESAPRSPKTIFYLGRLEPRKGLVYLLKAYRLLAQEDRDLRLVIAGAGPDRSMLERRVHALQLPNVEFLGYVTEEQKLQLFAAADVFCSPAVYGESFGIVLLEAMASGLVTIAGDNPGYASVMKGFGAISLVSPRNVPDLARRLKLMIEEPSLREGWRQWAASYVQQYDYEQIVDRYEQLYQVAYEQHAHRIRANRALRESKSTAAS